MHCVCKAYTVPLNAPVRHGENWSCPVPGALSVRDASLQLGVSTSTIRRRIDDGELRSFRIGGAIRIPYWLAQILAQSRQKAKAEKVTIAGRSAGLMRGA
jgi:excisionase family DNA binding protein